jgi:Putative zinc- or iron-chelating domain
MQESQAHSIEEIGIRVPPPLAGNRALRDLVHRLAEGLRAEAVPLARRAIDRAPETKLETLLALMKVLVFGRADALVEEVLDSDAPVACSPGCTACCYQTVQSTIPEAILIALHLGDPDDPRRRRVLDAAAAFAGMSALERKRTGKPCPLLGDGRCSVYDDRPLACRSVLSANAEGCRASLLSVLAGRDELPNDYFLAAQYLIRGDGAALRGICRDLGLQHEAFDLVQMLAALIRDPGIIERWLAGERVFAAVPSRKPPAERMDHERV